MYMAVCLSIYCVYFVLVNDSGLGYFLCVVDRVPHTLCLLLIFILLVSFLQAIIYFSIIGPPTCTMLKDRDAGLYTLKTSEISLSGSN